MAEQIHALTPIHPSDRFREVLGRIEEFTKRNDLQPGDRLPSDRDLAAALRVSRPLVRQALKVLEGLGRVEARQGSGTFISNNSHHVAASELIRGLAKTPHRQTDLRDARAAIELAVLHAAFQIAVVQPNPRKQKSGLLVELRQVLDRRHAELLEDPEEASLGLEFEAAIGRYCGNEVLRRLQGILHEAWLQLQIDVSAPMRDRFALHADHEAIYQALEMGDERRAVDLLSKHLGVTNDRPEEKGARPRTTRRRAK